jgi:hypothetical protein
VLLGGTGHILDNYEVMTRLPRVVHNHCFKLDCFMLYSFLGRFFSGGGGGGSGMVFIHQSLYLFSTKVL